MATKLQVLIDQGMLDRLPVTFSTYCFEQMREWDLLFPAEQSYYERLLALLDRSPAGEVDRVFAGVRAAEQRMGVTARTWPKRQFTLDQVDFLNRNAHYAEWRAAVAQVFARIDPLLDAEIAKRGHARLVVVISPGDLPVGPDRMWQRIEKFGRRVAIAPPEDSSAFSTQLLGGLNADYATAHPGTYGSWTIEADNKLAAGGGAIKLSYAQLEKYRRRLMGEVNQLARAENIRGPRQLVARLKQLKILPEESGLAADGLMAEFTRATLLSGNGTLLVNNTFVEWATMQAVRRARPSVMVIGFGIRNKVKPFSSLLIYADQESTNPIPTQMDTLGSYVDLEIFHQYVWQEFEKYVEYRKNTAYVFVAEGMDQMFVIAPEDFGLKGQGAPVGLGEVNRHLRDWVNLA